MFYPSKYLELAMGLLITVERAASFVGWERLKREDIKNVSSNRILMSGHLLSSPCDAACFQILPFYEMQTWEAW